MDLEEAIDLMLEYDCDNNPNGQGFISPGSLFDKLEVPEHMRTYVLQAALDLEFFEYNNRRIGIRATFKGKEMYTNGGMQKHKKRESIEKTLNNIERIIKIIKP